MSTKLSKVVPAIVIGLVLIQVGGAIFNLSANQFATQWERAEAWCEDRHDGDLVNANVIGDHGGLHCEFENGTTVHMDSVNLNRSPNATQARA